MTPDYLENDYVVVSQVFRRRKISVGDDVVLNHRKFGRIIKRVASVDSDQQEIECFGVGAESTSREALGRVSLRDVYGVPIWRISRPRC